MRSVRISVSGLAVLVTVVADSADQGGLSIDLTAVLREALSNVARHAHAAKVDVDLVVDTSQPVAVLTAKVTDNGIGIGATTRSSGTANLRHRAERRGGTFTLGPNTPNGTCLEWRVPITPASS